MNVPVHHQRLQSTPPKSLHLIEPLPTELRMKVALRQITPVNFRDLLTLRTTPAQEEFVASNTKSLAEAWLYQHCQPLAITVNMRPVGFLMYGLPFDDDAFWLHRIMIDQRYQGKGYGRAALRQLIKDLRIRPDFTELRLSLVQENTVAERMCMSQGFNYTGELLGSELIMLLRL